MHLVVPCLSNAGGGGERVLFTAIAQLQREEAHVVCVVYTGDLVGKDAIISNAKVALSPCCASLAIMLIASSTGSIRH
jgi:hypothetical protein